VTSSYIICLHSSKYIWLCNIWRAVCSYSEVPLIRQPLETRKSVGFI